MPKTTLRFALTAAVLGASFASSILAERALLPREDALAKGLRVAGRSFAEGATAGDVIPALAKRALDRRVVVTLGDAKVVEATLAELGATIDAARLVGDALRVGRGEGLLTRIDGALEARAGRVDLPLRVSVPVEALAERLALAKDDHDQAPLAAKLDVVTRAVKPHTVGRYLDVYATAEAIERAASRDPLGEGDVEIVLPIHEVTPAASAERVASIDTSKVLGSFETRFGYVGNQVGRAQNIQRAMDGVNGLVLLPGDVVSFNANVGPRSIENGFAEAPEIYKGEIREGIGGGTCQVAGTLHAAAYLGGLDVVERANHSRPSGYIKMGLDATVVYPTVDLKLKNPYSFPVVVHATIDKGTLTFTIHGREAPAKVTFMSDTVGVADYKRKVEESPLLKEGAVKLKQKGIRGYSIKKTRLFRYADGKERAEVTTDTYPPTFEIFQVGPGTDIDSVLPPLEKKDEKKPEEKPPVG